MNNVERLTPEDLHPASKKTATSLYLSAQNTALRDNLRSALATQAMNNAAMLASTRDSLLASSPNCREQLDLICKAYAQRTAEEIYGGVI